MPKLALLPLLLITACGGAEAPKAEAPAPEAPAPEAPKAEAPAAEAAPAEPAGDRSTPFKVIVTLDERASAELAKRKEGVVVDVTFSDPSSGGDDQGYRRQEIELSGAGGEASVGPIDLSPAKPGGGRLTEMNINVYSARKSGPDNLLSCSMESGEAGSLAASYTVTCSLI